MNPKQTFALEIGQSYKIAPPAKRKRRPGVIYLSGFAKLLEVTADGKARLQASGSGETFTLSLSENRIFKF